MNRQPQFNFTDATGANWKLTAFIGGITNFALESCNKTHGIHVVAQRAKVVTDETTNEAPFALELDDNVSVHLTVNAATELNKFFSFYEKCSAAIEVAA